jgi:hypothetical protein
LKWITTMRNQPFLLLRSLLLSGILLAMLFGAPRASASLGGCRADPVFTLSDGTILDLTAVIDTDVANITEINYVVHGPKGVGLVLALSTPTIGFKGKEHVTYVADAPAKVYITDTLVRTSVKNVSISSQTIFAANGLLSLQLSLTAQYKTVQGWDGQHLISTLHK